MRVDVDKTLENFDERCFLEGSRNNDVVNWTLLMMMQDETRTDADLVDAWATKIYPKLTDYQVTCLLAWEEMPEEVIRRVCNYYNGCDYDELEDLLICGVPYIEYTV